MAVAVTGVARRDVWHPANAAPSFRLNYAPLAGTLVAIYRNGVLLEPGADYTLAAQALTFTAQPVAAGDVIQAMYWSA